ncbi:hypothetical protein B0H14DRAFT_2705411 [Mycena olivaceomarginata]|nr:hypothetical protein B0H14DRAFT_2705411 [Mycena olivaceomarginata]
MIADLRNSQSDVRDTALKSLSVLTEIAELREAILPAIPGIIAVLNSNPRARKAALISLSRLADTAHWREIRPAVPASIAALRNTSLVENALECLTRLADIAKLRAEILAAIPAVISVPTDSRLTVREAALKAITRLATMADPDARLDLLAPGPGVEDWVVGCFARVLVALGWRSQPNIYKNLQYYEPEFLMIT